MASRLPSNKLNSGHSLFEPKRREEKRKLPLDFKPTPYSVLIGRGKLCAEAVGNRRLRVIVSQYLDNYSKAVTRIEKSIIVSKIVDTVQDACPVGAFIKFEDKCWWEVSDNTARERVGSLLRDQLHDSYKSSSKAKLAKRKRMREKTSLEDETAGSESSSQEVTASLPYAQNPSEDIISNFPSIVVDHYTTARQKAQYALSARQKTAAPLTTTLRQSGPAAVRKQWKTKLGNQSTKSDPGLHSRPGDNSFVVPTVVPDKQGRDISVELMPRLCTGISRDFQIPKEVWDL